MGAAGLNAVRYSGSAANGNFGQSRTISFGLASTTIRNYTRTIDFTQPASHASGDPIPPGVRGGPPPQPGAPGSYDQMITPANAAWAQQLQIWVTPWGFLRAPRQHQRDAAHEEGRRDPAGLLRGARQKAPVGQPHMS
jgi:hypothetical protein